jgi:hypothetical protein
MGTASNFDSNLYPKPRTSPERTYALHSRFHSLTLGAGEILGHTSWPKEAARRANAHCLRPQVAEPAANVYEC